MGAPFLAGAYLPPELLAAAAAVNNGSNAVALAEQAVLGAVLRDPAEYQKLAGKLDASQFLFESHRFIYAEIQRLFDAGQPVDVVVVAEELAVAGREHASGGLAYLGALVNETPGGAALMSHAARVVDGHVRRQIVGRLADGAGSAAGGQGDTGAVIDALQGDLDRIREPLRTRDGQSGLVGMSDVLADCVSNIQEVLDGTAPPLLSTGWADLDEKLGGGLNDGELVVIAGRSSMGKTALGMGVALNVARNLGESGAVAVFSLEMSRRDLGKRLIATAGGVDLAKLRAPQRMTDEDFSRMAAGLGVLNSLNLQIDDAAHSVASLAQAARRFASEKPLRLIVVDYLQLVTPASARDVREQQVAQMSRQIKALAKELNVPVILLAQISRKTEDRTDKRPMMSDLRESGAIEQDADVILLLYRDEYYNHDTPDKEVAEVNIAKSRNGQRNTTARLRWREEIQRFEDLGSDYCGNVTPIHAASARKPGGRNSAV